MKIADIISTRDCRELAKLVDHKIDKDGTVWIKHKKAEEWHVRVTKTHYYNFEHDCRGGYNDLLAWLLTEANHGNTVASAIFQWIEIANAEVEMKETELAFKLNAKINMMFDGLNNY